MERTVNALRRDLFALVLHIYATLARDVMTARHQFPLQGGEVHLLQETEAERVVHLVECPDHGVGEGFFDEGRLSHARTVAVFARERTTE